jgi:hypothetical protein
VARLLELDAVVNGLRERHGGVFGGVLWAELMTALEELRLDAGDKLP